MLHISVDSDDRRVALRARIRGEIDQLVENLQRAASGHLVVRELAAAAHELHRRLEVADPILPRREKAPRKGVVPVVFDPLGRGSAAR